MAPVIITNPPRADADDAHKLSQFGVATVHEALGKVGYLGPHLRSLWLGATVGGPAVTALCWPGDNLMIHAAVEQCQPGDVLVVTTTSGSTDGMFGELLATSLQQRGVRGVVLDCGVRDTADLRTMRFPVWSRAISAQGTVKASGVGVNVPVVVGGQLIHAGDVILGDDDGVMCVPRNDVARAISSSQSRVDKESQARAAFRDGQLGIDRYGLRELLAKMGTVYTRYEDLA